MKIKLRTLYCKRLC